MTIAEAIALFDTPDLLMRRCYLHIAGGDGAAPANGQAQPATFSVVVCDAATEAATGQKALTARGFTTGVSGLLGIKKERPFVKLAKQSTYSPKPSAQQINAYYIPMVQTSDAANSASHYTLPTTGGTQLDLMITSKLSGCTFGVGKDNGGSVLVSHIQPPGKWNLDETTKREVLENAVTSGFHAVTAKFARGGAYTDMAAVIGRFDGTAWKFYLQASTMDKKDRYVITHAQVVG